MTSHANRNSSLLNLPPELRDKIWRMVLGGNLIHILNAPQKLSGVLCTERDDGYEHTRCHSCWELTEQPRNRGFGFVKELFRSRPSNSKSKSTDLLHLPLTCRAVYEETISIIYNDNAFDLNVATAIIRFQRGLVAPSISEVRELQVTWDNVDTEAPNSNDFDTWSQACESLSKFTGLEKLTLRIGMHCHSYDNIANWKSSLEPLGRFNGPAHFDVILSSFDADLADEVKSDSYPFRLQGELRYFPPELAPAERRHHGVR